MSLLIQTITNFNIDLNKLTNVLLDQILDNYQNNANNLADDLRNLKLVLDNVFNSEKERVSIAEESFKKIVYSLCLPMCKTLHKKYGNIDRKMLTLVCELLIRSLQEIHEDNIFHVLNMCYSSLEEYVNCLKYSSETVTDGSYVKEVTYVHPECAVVILKYILEDPKSIELIKLADEEWSQKLLNRIKELLLHCNEHFGAMILTLIIPKLTKNKDKKERAYVFQILIDVAFSFFVYDYSDALSKRSHVAYLILSNVWEQMESNVDTCFIQELLNSSNFWHIIQQGLVHHDPLNQKRAMFIFKGVLQDLEKDVGFYASGDVFWWKKNDQSKLTKIWNNFILILESLEERQVHIIKPVLPRVIELLSFAQKHQKSENNNYNIHISWIAILYQRMFVHESKFINRWGVSQFLQLNISKENLIHDKMEKFIFQPLLDSLNDSSLFTYYEEDLTEKCPTIATLLITFLQNCKMHLDGTEYQSTFFSHLLFHITSKTWNTVSLLYVSQALAQLPKMHAWNDSTVALLGGFVTVVIKTQDVYLRGAIQFFLVKALIKLAAINEVTFTSLANTLAAFRGDECLQRNTDLWNEISEWLSKAYQSSKSLSRENLTIFCKRFVASLMDDKSSEEEILCICPRKAARLLVLMLDGHILTFTCTESLLFADLFMPLRDLFLSFNFRPYLNEISINRCLNLLVGILGELNLKEDSKLDSVQNSLMKWLQPCFEEIFKFICNKIPLATTKIQDLDHLDLLLEIFRYLWILSRNYTHHYNYINKLAETCLLLFHNDEGLKESFELHLQKYSAMKCLSLICSFSKLEGEIILLPNIHSSMIELTHSQFSSKELSRPLKKVETKSTFHRIYQNCWGRMVSDYMCCMWQCMEYYLMHYNHPIDILDVSHQALDVLSISADIAGVLCKCLKGILPKILDKDEVLFTNMLDHLWNAIFERRKTDYFWNSITNFIEMLFQEELLKKAKTIYLEKYVDLALNMSDKTPTVFCIIVRHCCKIWQEKENCGLGHHLKILVNALIFGFVHRKDQRISSEAALYINSLGNSCSVNVVNESSYFDASYVRIDAIGVLLKLSPDNICDQAIAKKLLVAMLEREKELTLHRVRYFGNSLTHRIKNRVWQCILLLEPLISQEMHGDLFEWACEELMKEGSQPSVRLYQEWLIMRLLPNFPSLIENIWIAMKKAASVRVGSIVSFLAIITHVGKTIKNLDKQSEFLMIALAECLPWCMAQNFNVRVTAQVTCHYLWNICKASNLKDVLRAFKAVDAFLNFTVDNGNASKNTQKLLEDFYYSAFHCQDHYSLETIFYEFPRLYCLASDEWISPSLFKQRISYLKELSYETFIPLYNKNNLLSNFSKSPWVMRSNGLTDQEDSDEIFIASENIQKKAIPWKQLLMDEQGILPDECDENLSRKGLVVVASIIERIPNLGGLCRTCEIFGASEYVIGSLKYIEDKQFQNLSVSSEKWIPIKEVKQQHLKEYLLFMRENGYTLVGAEQTAFSCKLDTFKFPVKTLLLLGNEKQGIPVELIQLLDVCLEIPQKGVIRSLNVHVSGAVMIWEYARQHLLR